MYYRDPWNAERVAFLVEWFPHLGTYAVADALGISRHQVKAKVDKLKLKKVPKTERLCIQCRTEYQFARYGGMYCKKCHLLRRKESRRAEQRSLERWVAEATNTTRHRSKTPCDLTTEYMVALWHRQNGCCYYSGSTLQPPTYGKGRKPFSPSIDRIDPKQGYVQGNVVWAAWICNAGKNDLSVDQYVTLCSLVATHKREPLESVHDITAVP